MFVENAIIQRYEHWKRLDSEVPSKHEELLNSSSELFPLSTFHTSTLSL